MKKKKLLSLLLSIFLLVNTYGQYFNADYAAGFSTKNNVHTYNDFSIGFGKFFKGGIGIGVGIGIAGARSPMFGELTYRPNKKKDEMYYNVRMGVDYMVKFYFQGRIGYQMNYNSVSIPIFIHYTTRYNKQPYLTPNRNERLYGIGVAFRISEKY